jgi:hypothetical protein
LGADEEGAVAGGSSGDGHGAERVSQGLALGGRISKGHGFSHAILGICGSAFRRWGGLPGLPQGLKPLGGWAGMARLKPCPFEGGGFGGRHRRRSQAPSGRGYRHARPPVVHLRR